MIFKNIIRFTTFTSLGYKIRTPYSRTWICSHALKFCG